MAEQADVQAEIDKVIEEAKDDFDLVADLEGRSYRQDTLSLFIDEKNGEELGRLETAVGSLEGIILDNQNRINAVYAARDEHDALRKDIADDDEEARAEWTARAEAIAAAITAAEEFQPQLATIREQYDGFSAKAEELRKEVYSSGYTVTLRSVPPIIEEDAHREARKILGIKQKGVADADQDEYDRVFTRVLLTKQVTRIVKHKNGAVRTSIDLDWSRSLLSLLPRGEKARLVGKMSELQFKNSISDSVVKSADFSRGI